MAINADLVEANRLLEQRIAAHQQVEAALRKSEERYRTLFKNNHTVADARTSAMTRAPGANWRRISLRTQMPSSAMASAPIASLCCIRSWASDPPSISDEMNSSETAQTDAIHI